MRTLPNTFIIGAPRSGTTSLHNYLGQHPDVFMSRLKEPRYFAYKNEVIEYEGPADPITFNQSTITDRDEYVGLFREADSVSVVGETSPIYMYRSDVAAENIQQAVDDPHFIAILRNPVDRAYSDFLNMVRLAREPLLDFETALEREAKRKKKNWSPFYYYVEKGMYASQLEYYYSIFDKSRIKVLLFDELIEDEQEVMRQIVNFLELEEHSFDLRKTYNRSRYPESQLTHSFVSYGLRLARGPFQGPVWRTINWLRMRNLKDGTPEMNASTRARLKKTFRAEIKRLQDLTGTSLNHWL